MQLRIYLCPPYHVIIAVIITIFIHTTIFATDLPSPI